MITEVSLIGFKSFYDETIEMAPLTVLTGLNSSGKSSVLQAIRMLGRTYGYSNIILEGHGTGFELRNTYYGAPFSLEARFIDPDGESRYIGSGPDARNDGGSVYYPNIIYVSADRYGPRPSIPVETTNHSLGPRGDNVLKCIDYFSHHKLAPSLIHENAEDDTFESNVRAWLGTIAPGVNFQSEIQTYSDSSYAFYDGHRAMNVGFGLSYTLPIIVALFMGTIEENTIVLIENPEAHLHPKGQTEIARLICAAVDAGTQVVVETHSDHLFDGIRIYAKQHCGFASKVATHWFELDERKLTHIESPRMDDKGNLDSWPAGMFDQFGINSSILIG